MKELNEIRTEEIAHDTRWPRLSRLGVARMGTVAEKNQEKTVNEGRQGSTQEMRGG